MQPARGIQVCVNTLPRRKDISNDIREAIVFARQCGMGYKANSKQFNPKKKQLEKLFPNGKRLRDLPRNGQVHV